MAVPIPHTRDDRAVRADLGGDWFQPIPIRTALHHIAPALIGDSRCKRALSVGQVLRVPGIPERRMILGGPVPVGPGKRDSQVNSSLREDVRGDEEFFKRSRSWRTGVKVVLAVQASDQDCGSQEAHSSHRGF